MLRLVFISLLLATCASAGGWLDTYADVNVLQRCYGEAYQLEVMRGVKEAAQTCQDLPVFINMEADDAQPEEIDDLPYEGSGEEEDEDDHREIKSPIQEEMEEAWESIMDLLGDREPVILPIPLLYLPRGGQSLRSRRRREALYSSEFLKSALSKVQAKISNFTCTLEQLGVIDGNYTINPTNFTDIEGVDEDLKAQAYDAAQKCLEFTKCLPTDFMAPALPESLQRVFTFSRCYKKARRALCMRHDLKKHLNSFDVESLSFLDEDDDDDRRAETLLKILWATDTSAFQIY